MPSLNASLDVHLRLGAQLKIACSPDHNVRAFQDYLGPCMLQIFLQSELRPQGRWGCGRGGGSSIVSRIA